MSALRIAIAVAIFAIAVEAHACDCAWHAYTSLKRHGIRLKTVPSIAVNDWHKFTGVYGDGVVHVHSLDCRVILHEFVHHYQAEKLGPPKGEIQWYSRERDAAIVTMHVWEAC